MSAMRAAWEVGNMAREMEETTLLLRLDYSLHLSLSSD
jgi:hypothetical protein